MSHKGCKRCSYKDLVRIIDYKKSAQEQKLVWKEYHCCIRCKYSKDDITYHECNLNDIPACFKDVDLTKIVHEHDDNATNEYYDYKNPEYDKEGNCFKIIKIEYRHCSFCDKLTNKIEHIIDSTTNDEHLSLLSTARKEELERRKLIKQHEHGICPITGKPFNLIDKGWCNDRPFMPTIEHVENHCSECDCYLNGKTIGGYESKVGFWWK